MAGNNKTDSDKTPKASTKPAEVLMEKSEASAETATTTPKVDAVMQPSADSSTSPKFAPKSTQTNTASQRSVILFMTVLMVLSIAVILGAYWGWQIYQEQLSRLVALEAATAEQQALTQEISREQQQWVASQQRIFVEQYQALEHTQAQMQQRLDSHGARIRGLSGTSRQDWLLAEARYLLRLANQRLLVEQNTLGAQGLLEAADNILQSIDDNGLLPVRDAVAKELIALKIADNVDKEGLYLKISAIKEQIQALPLIPFLKKEAEPTVEKIIEQENNPELADSIQTESTWYQIMGDSIKTGFAGLSTFIQIRQHDTAPELLMSEEQQSQVFNHLMLMLEQAQYALLHEKKGIYRDSLSKAQQLWAVHYAHYQEYEVIRAEIAHLKQQAISPNLPDISRSSSLISEYIDQYHQVDKMTTVIKDANNEEAD